MNGMGRSDRVDASRVEHAVEALIPPVRNRPRPPAPLIVPPAPPIRPSGEAGSFVLDTARLDASGRFTSRVVMRALGWQPGQRVELSVTDHAVTFTAAVSARLAIGQRSGLAVPAPARVSAGLDRDARVVLIAVPCRAMLIVHPPALIASLLAGHYKAQSEGRDAA